MSATRRPYPHLTSYAITVLAAVCAAVVMVGASQCQGAGVRSAWATYLELDGALRLVPVFLKAVAASALADSAVRCLSA